MVPGESDERASDGVGVLGVELVADGSGELGAVVVGDGDHEAFDEGREAVEVDAFRCCLRVDRAPLLGILLGILLGWGPLRGPPSGRNRPPNGT